MTGTIRFAKPENKRRKTKRSPACEAELLLGLAVVYRSTVKRKWQERKKECANQFSNILRQFGLRLSGMK